MCGIAGFVYNAGGEVDPNLWRDIDRRLRHRGPDDFGVLGWKPGAPALLGRDFAALVGQRAVLLHRRLAILDLSARGWQPMQRAGGRYSIVFNGEIYNYLELRRELVAAGESFVSDSDTEVLLCAYSLWGPSCFKRFVGMFACAILDLEKQRLVLARDHFGIKPLYFVQGAAGFGFASEVPPLLRLPGVASSANAARMFSYLRFGLTDYGAETMFRDVAQIPAAHWIEVKLDAPAAKPEVHCYWHLPSYQKSTITPDEASEQLRKLFLRNVQLHMRSDVPIGYCLSGGIDSSAIVMGARHVVGHGGDFKTFTFVSSDPSKSEERWARIVAQEAKASGRQIRPESEDLVAVMSELVATQGEPFATTSIFAQYKVFELAAKNGMKVVLDGQGADELLGGYWTFVGARGASLLRQGNLLGAMTLMRSASRMAGTSTGLLMAHSSGFLIPPVMQRLGRILVGRELMPRWLNRSWFSARIEELEVPWSSRGSAYLNEQLRQSVSTSSLPMLLRFEDRNSMHFSIESRVPFLTVELAEFLLMLPEHYLIDDQGLRKAVFRSAMRGIVPNAILDRRDKIGFETPEATWMRELRPWIELQLRSEVARSVLPIDVEAIRSNWAHGQLKNSAFLWRCLNAIEWSRQFNVQYQ